MQKRYGGQNTASKGNATITYYDNNNNNSNKVVLKLNCCYPRLVDMKSYPVRGYNQAYLITTYNASTLAVYQISEFRVEVFCEMKLHQFPFDTQNCLFEVS